MSRQALFIYAALMAFTASIGLRLFIVHAQVAAADLGLVPTSTTDAVHGVAAKVA